MTAATEPNVLHCTDRIFIGSRGWLYMGPAPFAFRKDNPAEMAMVMQRPWVIDHPDCAPVGLWRAVGLDSYATWDVRQGSTIGLLVEPWEEQIDSLPAQVARLKAAGCDWVIEEVA